MKDTIGKRSFDITQQIRNNINARLGNYQDAREVTFSMPRYNYYVSGEVGDYISDDYALFIKNGEFTLNCRGI